MQSGRGTHFITLLFFICLLGPSTAWSAPLESKRHLTAGVELFRWQEFDINQRRLLSEQGLRLSLRADWDDVWPNNSYGRINLKTRLYSGNINYDGQTQSLDPAKSGIFVASSSRYYGLDTELEGLFLLANHNDTALLLSLGFDLWRRSISNGISAQGDPVNGGREDYRLLYSRLGLHWQHHGAYGSIQARAGIKYPLRVDEQVIGVTLHPKPAPSLFLAYRLYLADRRHTIIEIYYDSLRLKQSPPVTTALFGPIVQPESRYDIVGIMVGIPF